jgi:hypothetical protein
VNPVVAWCWWGARANAPRLNCERPETLLEGGSHNRELWLRSDDTDSERVGAMRHTPGEKPRSASPIEIAVKEMALDVHRTP